LEDQIFNWTYSDEQNAKASWRGEGNNPYASLPRMVMLTYKVPDSITQVAMGGEYDEFDLNEFFKAEPTEKGKSETARFIHENDVQKWLELIQGKGNVVDVFLKDCWIVIADSKTKNCITLYKIDLGCGDEFNHQYISKMMEKLNTNKDELIAAKIEVETESAMYRDMIADATSQIFEYKSMIKNLESLCDGYQAIIDNNIVKVSQANRVVAETINTMIGKKEF
jgi:hypothetical protein